MFCDTNANTAFLFSQVARNEKQWTHWFDKEKPEEEVIPDGYNNSLDVLHRLLVVWFWCSDHTLARKYITDSLGEKYAEGVILDLRECGLWAQTGHPWYCLLPMGSDPSVSIEALAKNPKVGELRILNCWCEWLDLWQLP